MKGLKDLFKNEGVQFIITFLAIYVVLYYGTMFFIGVAVPGGVFHSDYLEKNGVGYVIAIRKSLLYGSETMMKLLQYNVVVKNDRLLSIVNGPGVYFHNSCIGYGVFSFWIAFVVANRTTLALKLKWLFGGLFLIWFINVTRVCLILISNDSKWPSVSNLDHHTMFNISAYLLIFILIYFYTKSEKKRKLQNTHNRFLQKQSFPIEKENVDTIHS